MIIQKNPNSLELISEIAVFVLARLADTFILL